MPERYPPAVVNHRSCRTRNVQVNLDLDSTQQLSAADAAGAPRTAGEDGELEGGGGAGDSANGGGVKVEHCSSGVGFRWWVAERKEGCLRREVLLEGDLAEARGCCRIESVAGGRKLERQGFNYQSEEWTGIHCW